MASVLFPPVEASTIRVPTDQATIQAAINVAVDGDLILVAPGIYFENISFLGKAITVKSEQGPGVTIIDAKRSGTVVGGFAPREGPPSVLEGFSLQHGNAVTGGGIDIQYSSPAIIGNIIRKNWALSGGGIRVEGFQSRPIIMNNVISDNLAYSQTGGGISVDSGGDPLIIQNVIRKNMIYPQIPDNPGFGAGICWGAASDAHGVLLNNTIVDNRIDSIGGGEGSGLYFCGDVSQVYAANNIIVSNSGQTAISCGEAPIFKFNNAFNQSGVAYGGLCQAGINGNISADPLFSDSSKGDYSLKAGSPSIDAGENTTPELPTMDFDGAPRILDSDGDGQSVIDMGVYEFNPAGLLQFSSGSFGASEKMGSALVTITRKGGSKGTVTIKLDSSDGTATADLDYAPVSETLTFNDGEVSKNFSVQIFDDNLSEGKETVNLALSNPTGGATLGDRSNAVLNTGDIASTDLFPLATGTTWVYQVNKAGISTTKVLNETVLINGVETRVLYYDGEMRFFTSGVDGIRLHRLFWPHFFIPELGYIFVDLTLTFDPPVSLANGLAVLGETEVSVGTIRTNNIPYIGELVFDYNATFTFRVTEKVTVPAGNFEVLQLQGTIDAPGSGYGPILFTWDLAEQVGIVKYELQQGIGELVGMTVNPTPLKIGASSLPEGEIGSDYGANLELSGGIPPYSVEAIKGSLPSGLSVNSEGIISGTPAPDAKSSSFTVEVKDSIGTTIRGTFKLTILKGLEIATTALKEAGEGMKYSARISVKLGKKPYRWEVTGEGLPVGLSLHPSTGVISGIPSVIGAFNLSIKVTDALGVQKEANYTLTVKETLTITTKSLPKGRVGKNYKTTLKAKGGLKPYKWSIVSGNLPEEVVLETDTGKIIGVPSAPGVFPVTVKVADVFDIFKVKNLMVEIQ